MKTRLSIILAAIFCVGRTVMVHAALTVAVYDFKGEANAEKYGSLVTALVTSHLADRTNLIMLERAKLNKALNEQAFGVSGMVSSDAAAQIGQITGAKVLVAGQVVQTAQGRVIILANIIGTETGRLFAAKVEGGGNNLPELIEDLSGKIAQTIAEQADKLTMTSGESRAARLDRIVKSLKGPNRPAVSINMTWPGDITHNSATAEWEFGIILLKAGFPAVDAKSDRKPDIEFKGVCDHGEGSQRGELASARTVIELKVQERESGNIVVIDREESTATGPTSGVADRLSQIEAVDALAERVLPLLAK